MHKNVSLEEMTNPTLA